MCSKDSFYLKSFAFRSNRADENIYWTVFELYKRRLCWSLWCLRATMQFSSVSCAENVVGTHLALLDLSEYMVMFASAWLQRNYSFLIQIVKPLLMARTSDKTALKDIQNLLRESLEVVARDLPVDGAGAFVQDKKQMPQAQFRDVILLVPEGRWHMIVATLWGYASSFLKHKLNLLSPEHEESNLFRPPGRRPSVSTLITIQRMSHMLLRVVQ